MCAERFLQRSLREWPQDASRSARSEEWDAAGARRSALWRVMWSEVSYFESVAFLNHNLRLGFCAWQKKKFLGRYVDVYDATTAPEANAVT